MASGRGLRGSLLGVSFSSTVTGVFESLCGDAKHLATNLKNYINPISENMRGSLRRPAIGQYFTVMLPAIPDGRDLSQKLKAALMLDAGHFEARWAAD